MKLDQFIARNCTTKVDAIRALQVHSCSVGHPYPFVIDIKIQPDLFGGQDMIVYYKKGKKP